MTPLSQRQFTIIKPDNNANWIHQSESEWDDLIPIADKKTKAAKGKAQEKAIFRLYSLGIVTNRDEWAYDFDPSSVDAKIRLFSSKFNDEIERWRKAGRPKDTSDLVSREIKWTSELEAELRREKPIKFDTSKITRSAYRPFVSKWTYFAKPITHRPYQNFDLFPDAVADNASIITAVEPRAAFSVLGTKVLVNKDFFMPSAAQHFARYRYTKAGERVDNITDWALKKFREAYASPSMVRQAHHEGDGGGAASNSPLRGGRDPKRSEGSAGGGQSDGVHFPNTPTPAGEPADPPLKEEGKGRAASAALTKDDIFHYVYAVLHDPVYRGKYALNLKREFPRIPFYPDFWKWAEWGKRLMELHIGYETVEPWPLDRLDMPDEKARAAGVTPKAMLRADRDNGIIRLDTETQLSAIPKEAWDYRLGNRSGLDWILDQYREKTPKDPTIREKFNTYRFADYKEKVADLIARVARVSVETVAITEAMKGARR